MLIRDAIVDDLPAIVAIYNASIPSRIVTADIEPVTVLSRMDWFYAHDPQAYPLWVVEIEHVTAGWLGFQPFYGRPAYRQTAELSIYISPQYQRQGIGKQLLARAIAASSTLGITTLLGFIFADNLASLRLFEQFGFQQWGCLPQVAKFEQSEQDLVIVGKPLKDKP